MIDIQDLKTLDDYIDFKKAEGRTLSDSQVDCLEISQKAMEIVRSKFDGNRANILDEKKIGVNEISKSSSISNMRDFVEILTYWFSESNKLSSDKITYQSLIQRIIFTAIFSQKNAFGTCIEYATNTALELLRKSLDHHLSIYQESSEIHSWISIKGPSYAKDIIVDSWSICPFPILREDFEDHGFEKYYSILLKLDTKTTQAWLSEYDDLSEKIKKESKFNFSDQNDLRRAFVLINRGNSLEFHQRKVNSNATSSFDSFLLSDIQETNQYNSNESLCAIRLRKLTTEEVKQDYELNVLFSTERKKNHFSENQNIIKFFTKKTGMLFSLKKCLNRLEILAHINPNKHKKITENLEIFKQKMDSKYRVTETDNAFSCS